MSDNRPLPSGWTKQFDMRYRQTYYVDTRSNPPRSSWIHPLDESTRMSPLPPTTSGSAGIVAGHTYQASSGDRVQAYGAKPNKLQKTEIVNPPFWGIFSNPAKYPNRSQDSTQYGWYTSTDNTHSNGHNHNSNGHHGHSQAGSSHGGHHGGDSGSHHGGGDSGGGDSGGGDSGGGDSGGGD